MGSSGRHDASKSIADLAKAVRVSAGDATDETRLVDGFTPGPFDVICARGKTPRSHAGNIRMQELITELMDEYSSAKTKLDKSMIVTNVVDSVNDKSPSGGFVRKEMGKWTRLSAAAAREKVSQWYVYVGLHAACRSQVELTKTCPQFPRLTLDQVQIKLKIQAGSPS